MKLESVSLKKHQDLLVWLCGVAALNELGDKLLGKSS